MFTYKLRIIIFISVLLHPLFVPVAASAGGGEILQVLIRTGDGGQQKNRHLKKIKSYLSGSGCRVSVEFIKNDSPTPSDTDLEFSPQPVTLVQESLPGFRLLAQARTIEGKTKIGGAILAIAATGIDSLSLLAGERFSFVSTSSPSGYQLPMKMLDAAGVKPDEQHAILVGNHVGSVSMLMHGDSFAAAAAAPLARDWVAVNNELNIVALTPLVATGGWWINRKIGDELAMICAKALAELTGSQLKAFPAWVGGFNPK
jgi:hypothetical protein